MSDQQCEWCNVIKNQITVVENGLPDQFSVAGSRVPNEYLHFSVSQPPTSVHNTNCITSYTPHIHTWMKYCISIQKAHRYSNQCCSKAVASYYQCDHWPHVCVISSQTLCKKTSQLPTAIVNCVDLADEYANRKSSLEMAPTTFAALI